MITRSTLTLLEFPKLLETISSFAHSDATRHAVFDIIPLCNREEIEKRLSLIREIRRLSDQGTPLSFSQFVDISTFLLKLRPQGSVLEPNELSVFVPILTVLSDICAHLAGRKDIPSLKELTVTLTGFPDVLTILERSIDSAGNILDDASPELAEIREQVRRMEGKIVNKLEEIMRDKGVSLFLQDTFITQRSGRWVIPVRMDSKGQVPGVVHDVSRSGETAFIEPLPLISLSNELENLIAEQKAEEIRILRDISAMIRAVADEMSLQYRTIVYLDLLNCIALFADTLMMQNPQINDSGLILLENATHPLLSLTFQRTEGQREVVPLDVRLGGEYTVMVITGSNAGGKTVAIKTIGLLQLMAMSGMPVPADSSSSFPLMQDLLIDIGDEQSIENSLSTFSAHVANISGILRMADRESLVLIDELGTGTDPDEGAALACAVLKEIRSKEALLFATTHLTDIKSFVHRTEGMINASMEFDRETLTPLYKLRLGEPGQSHAIEIARRYGLPESVIESAKGLLGGIKVEFDNLIADLNAKRASYEAALGEIKLKQTEMEEKERILEEKRSEDEYSRKKILANAYKEASEIIISVKKEMHMLLEDIRKKGKEKVREATKKADSVREVVASKLRELDESDQDAPVSSEIKKGDIVFVRSLGYDVSVVGMDEKRSRLRVRSGGMEIDVPLSDIARKRGKSAGSESDKVNIEGIDEPSPSSITLVGLRADEALSRLEPFLNHASLGELQEVLIIHGFGTGILARTVRGHLQGHPLVKSFRGGTKEEGGAGVTIATLM